MIYKVEIGLGLKNNIYTRINPKKLLNWIRLKDKYKIIGDVLLSLFKIGVKMKYTVKDSSSKINHPHSKKESVDWSLFLIITNVPRIHYTLIRCERLR